VGSTTSLVQAEVILSLVVIGRWGFEDPEYC